LRVSDLKMGRAQNGWTFTLQGFAQDTPEGLLAVLNKFEAELTRGVFQVRVRESTHGQVMRGTAGEAVGLSRAGARENEKPFFITGTIE
jgi:hypothetical protein